MNSNNQSAKPPDAYSQPLADILGTTIALATLILPLFIISHFSSPDVQNHQEFLTYYLARGRK
ncbi:MAG: hypothetical protein EAZ76_13165 [Nostocales cyanobacterium]|nr:MAG: hypothetical protein EAZ87_16430 [Nostocales cyanobacterium]TAF12776.1 MAG: hypothetical protein EAZ76_13165 [Nostocales cyanobacterium]